MRFVLIADSFPPLRNSAAVQLRDLSREFVRQGHDITVLLPTPDLKTPWLLEDMDGVQVLRLRAPKTKDINYVRRTIGEFLMPFFMRRNLRQSPLAQQKWDGVIWYAPSIFHGPLANSLKKASGCKGYLIIRDIFPEWAVDMGLMGRGLPYRFFDAAARYQYSVADVIGVQTPGNLGFRSCGQWPLNHLPQLQPTLVPTRQHRPPNPIPLQRPLNPHRRIIPRQASFILRCIVIGRLVKHVCHVAQHQKAMRQIRRNPLLSAVFFAQLLAPPLAKSG